MKKKKAFKKKARKKGVNGKNKGSTFERKIRDILSAWTGLEFTRSPQSGAFGTVNKMHDWVGDVVPKSGYFAYSVECKKVESWNLEGFLVSSKSPIHKFWAQCVEQARKCDRIPLLIFSRNGMPPLCMTYGNGYPHGFAGDTFNYDSVEYPPLFIFKLEDLVKEDPSPWITKEVGGCGAL